MILTVTRPPAVYHVSQSATMNISYPGSSHRFEVSNSAAHHWQGFAARFCTPHCFCKSHPKHVVAPSIGSLKTASMKSFSLLGHLQNSLMAISRTSYTLDLRSLASSFSELPWHVLSQNMSLMRMLSRPSSPEKSKQKQEPLPK